MIIRFVVNNVFSFGSQTEFNMIPRPRLRTLNSHKYSISEFEVLKLSAIYGANGAGKSNLIKSLVLLKEIVIREDLPLMVDRTIFKFQEKGTNSIQTLAIEFFQNNIPYYYGIEFGNGIIVTEELYRSGLGKEEDVLIFERKTDPQLQTKLHFLDSFENDSESQVLKNVIEKHLIKPNKSMLKLLTSLNNKFLIDVKNAYDWFLKTLEIIKPDSKPIALAHQIDIDNEFKCYAEDIIRSFSVGITGIKSERKSLKEVIRPGDEKTPEELTKELEKSPNQIFSIRNKNGLDLTIVKEGTELISKELKLEHTGRDGISVDFNLGEESDGTIRLLDFIPAFKEVVSKNKVFVIDEIERSIHPLLVKELVKKFSFDEKSHGQLIFTTHESNLLDQEIFRQDEIWFTEKDKDGNTNIYSLSDFKEHNTIDIRKGYLNGRYGSIPFLANLQDLNWHRYDSEK
jgi:AAA15 family ATPase/GTPase